MVYELSISKNYVSDWNTKDAIRELLQNGIDSEKNGNELMIDYDKDTHTLFIKNLGCSLDISSLVLGNGNKSKDDKYIGGFGEGYKLALVVLLRQGYNVSIYTGTEFLQPYFEYSETFKTEVLKINSEPCETNYVSFVVCNILQDLFEELQEYFPYINNDFGTVINNQYGQILTDEKFKGKMFVEGLYIQDDENFKYGYNFKNEYVKLDRDRKAINYYSLRKLTAKSMITADNCQPEIFDAICKSYNDIRDIKEVVQDSNDNFIESFADMYRNKYNIDKKTMVATDGVVKILKRKGYDVVVGSEIESLLIAKQLNNEELLKQAKEELKDKNKEQEIWEELLNSDYLKLIKWYYKSKSYLPEVLVNEFENLCFNKYFDSTPYNFHNIMDEFIENLPESCTKEYIQNKIDSFGMEE